MAMKWVLLLLVMVVSASAKVVEYDWEVSYISSAPDCFAKTILGINGGYPGPTIRASQDDLVKVTLKNHLATEGITMHWHGIRQVGGYSHDVFV